MDNRDYVPIESPHLVGAPEGFDALDAFDSFSGPMRSQLPVEVAYQPALSVASYSDSSWILSGIPSYYPPSSPQSSYRAAQPWRGQYGTVAPAFPWSQLPVGDPSIPGSGYAPFVVQPWTPNYYQSGSRPWRRNYNEVAPIFPRDRLPPMNPALPGSGFASYMVPGSSWWPTQQSYSGTAPWRSYYPEVAPMFPYERMTPSQPDLPGSGFSPYLLPGQQQGDSWRPAPGAVRGWNDPLDFRVIPPYATQPVPIPYRPLPPVVPPGRR